MDIIDIGGDSPKYSLAGMMQTCGMKNVEPEYAVILGVFVRHIMRTFGDKEAAILPVKEQIKQLHPEIPSEHELHKAFCGSVIKHAKNMMKAQNVLFENGNLNKEMFADLEDAASIIAKAESLVPANLSTDSLMEDILRTSGMASVPFEGKNRGWEISK